MADTDKNPAAVCQEAMQAYGASVMALADGPEAPAQYVCGYLLEDGHISVGRSAYLGRDALVGMLGKMLSTYAENELSKEELRNLMLRLLQSGPGLA